MQLRIFMDKNKFSEYIVNNNRCSVWIVSSSIFESLELALSLIKENLDVKNNKNELANILNEKIKIELIGVFMGKALKKKAISKNKFKYIEATSEVKTDPKKDIMICQYKKNSVTSRVIYQNSLSYKYRFYLVDSLDTIPAKHRETDFIFD